MAAGDGLVVIQPTSIAFTGTSATITSTGSVLCSGVSSVSLNGVFSADYDNYRIVTDLNMNTTNSGFRHRYRSAGSDATGTDYTSQYIYGNGTSITGLRGTLNYGQAGDIGLWTSGNDVTIFGPYLSDHTSSRAVNALSSSTSAARIFDVVTFHAVAASYDGITLYPGSADFDGIIQVFGYEE